MTNTTFGDLTNNVNLLNNQGGVLIGLTARPGSGDVNPTYGASSCVIAPDGLSATVTWPTLVVTATLATPMTYADNVKTCTGLLQFATLLDDISFPAKTYACSSPYWAGTYNFYLRFPSAPVFVDGGPPNHLNIANNTNAILITPARGQPNNVSFKALTSAYGVSPFAPLVDLWWWRSPYTVADDFGFVFVREGAGYSISAFPAPAKPYGSPYGPYFCRNLFAYGMPIYGTNAAAGGNAIVSAKTALRCKQPVDNVNYNLVDNSDGTFSANYPTSFLSAPKGLMIFDPVRYLSAPPAGYVFDPSLGLYTSIVVTQYSDSVFGSLEWNYILPPF